MNYYIDCYIVQSNFESEIHSQHHRQMQSCANKRLPCFQFFNDTALQMNETELQFQYITNRCKSFVSQLNPAADKLRIWKLGSGKRESLIEAWNKSLEH